MLRSFSACAAVQYRYRICVRSRGKRAWRQDARKSCFFLAAEGNSDRPIKVHRQASNFMRFFILRLFSRVVTTSHRQQIL